MEMLFVNITGERENAETQYTVALAFCPLGRAGGWFTGVTEWPGTCAFTGRADWSLRRRQGPAVPAKNLRFRSEVLIQSPFSRATYQLWGIRQIIQSFSASLFSLKIGDKMLAAQGKVVELHDRKPWLTHSRLLPCSTFSLYSPRSRNRGLAFRDNLPLGAGEEFSPRLNLGSQSSNPPCLLIDSLQKVPRAGFQLRHCIAPPEPEAPS